MGQRPGKAPGRSRPAGAWGCCGTSAARKKHHGPQTLPTSRATRWSRKPAEGSRKLAEASRFLRKLAEGSRKKRGSKTSIVTYGCVRKALLMVDRVGVHPVFRKWRELQELHGEPSLAATLVTASILTCPRCETLGGRAAATPRRHRCDTVRQRSWALTRCGACPDASSAARCDICHSRRLRGVTESDGSP